MIVVLVNSKLFMRNAIPHHKKKFTDRIVKNINSYPAAINKDENNNAMPDDAKSDFLLVQTLNLLFFNYIN